MARIAALLLVIGGTLVVGPAAAQFGNIFGDAPPPRPPADVPNGPFPQQPPPVQYPGQPRPYPGQSAPGYSAPRQAPSAIETQPLPSPPGGASAAPVPQGSAQRPPGPSGRAPATPPPNNTAGAPPPPAPAAEALPPDDTVVEAPTPHIENGKAVFAGLDKISGRTISFDVAIGETVQFGALQVTPRACYTRPPTEATNTDAFVEVDEVTLQGEIKRIFTGWMFASSPGLHAVEHPIYDVWLTDCASPQNVKVAEPGVKSSPSPAAPAPGAAPKPRQAAPARQRPQAPGVQP